MPDELPKRKSTRLKNHDYSTVGAYFVTICVQERKPILSDVEKASDKIEYETILTTMGEIANKYLLSSNNIPGVIIDEYIIMPDHIHAIIILDPKKYTTRLNSKKLTATSHTNQMLSHVISTFKRFCNKEIGCNIFQRGYYDHIIRDREDYETRRRYIYENPIKWYYEHL